MPRWFLVAILALTCAQCTSVEGKTLKIGMMPYTFEPVSPPPAPLSNSQSPAGNPRSRPAQSPTSPHPSFRNADRPLRPTKPPPNLEQPIDGLYKRFWETVNKDVYDYDSVQFVPIMEYMTLQDTIGFLTRYLRPAPSTWPGPRQERPATARVRRHGLRLNCRTYLSVLGRKEIKQNNLMQFVTPSGEVWGMLVMSVLMGGFVIFALMFGEQANNVGFKRLRSPWPRSFAASTAESIESKYIAIVMSSSSADCFASLCCSWCLLSPRLTPPTWLRSGSRSPRCCTDRRSRTTMNARGASSQPIMEFIMPHIGFNVENGMSVEDNADPKQPSGPSGPQVSW